jgi:hypothetical protein
MPTHQHAKQKQRLMREVNDRLRDVAELDVSVFICECTDPHCNSTLELSLEKYDRIRSVPAWFVLTSDHADPTVDRVVEENGKFVVAERSENTHLAEP